MGGETNSVSSHRPNTHIHTRLHVHAWCTQSGVYASICVLLKQCIWRRGHGNSSVLPGSLHPGWTIVSPPPWSHALLSSPRCRLTSSFITLVNLHPVGVFFLDQDEDFVVGGLQISPTDHQIAVETPTARREYFLGSRSRPERKYSIIESITTPILPLPPPFSPSLPLHRLNILCHAPFGVTDAAVAVAAFIWHILGWLCQHLQRLPF